MNLLLEAVSNVTDWHGLGLKLSLTVNQLREMELTHPREGPSRLKAEMFNVWLKSSPNASWTDLITALEAMGEDRVASNVRAAYSPVAPGNVFASCQKYTFSYLKHQLLQSLPLKNSLMCNV